MNNNPYKSIIENVGGKKNISRLTHCVSRLRFVLKDDSVVNKDALLKTKGVLQVVKSGEQFQVVIGPEVTTYYDHIMGYLQEGENDQEIYSQEKETGSKESPKKREGIISRLIDLLSSVFTPIIYFLAASGMIKAFLSLMITLNLMSDKSDTYIILSAIGDIIFNFLPVVLAYTLANRFKTDQILSILIALALFYPTILDAATGNGSMTFLGIPFRMFNYASSVFPIMFAIYAQSWVEKYAAKFPIKMIKNFLTPILVLVIVVPLTFLVFGPIGEILGESLRSAYDFLYHTSPLLTGAFVGLIWQVITIFGAQWGFMPLDMAYTKAGFNPLNAMVAPTIVAQGGAALGVALRARQFKNKDIESIGMTAAVTTFFGVSEPSIYGTNLRFKKPFVIASVVAMLGGAVIGIVGIGATAYSIPTVLSLPNYMSVNFPVFLLSYFGSFVLSALLTWLFIGENDFKKDEVNK